MFFPRVPLTSTRSSLNNSMKSRPRVALSNLAENTKLKEIGTN